METKRKGKKGSDALQYSARTRRTKRRQKTPKKKERKRKLNLQQLGNEKVRKKKAKPQTATRGGQKRDFGELQSKGRDPSASQHLFRGLCREWSLTRRRGSQKNHASKKKDIFGKMTFH